MGTQLEWESFITPGHAYLPKPLPDKAFATFRKEV
jgi:hypothetical protein